MKKILQLLVVLVIPCIFITPAFTSCENEHPAVNVTLNSDYSGIVEAINSVNTTLLDKLALIEEAIKNGTVASGEANGLIKQALETMNGTLEEKLAAIEEAIKSQTTSLESKLGLIETALKTGFTDQKKALGEIKTALESIKGSVDGLDSAIDGVVKAIDKVTTAVDGTNTALTGAIAKALDDIFKAIDGLTDYSAILEAIKEAIENIEISGDGDDTEPEAPGKLKLTPLDLYNNPMEVIIPWDYRFYDNIKDTLIHKFSVDGDCMKLVGADKTETWNAVTKTDYSQGVGAVTTATNDSKSIDVNLCSSAEYGVSDSTYVYKISKYDSVDDITYWGEFEYTVRARPADAVIKIGPINAKVTDTQISVPFIESLYNYHKAYYSRYTLEEILSDSDKFIKFDDWTSTFNGKDDSRPSVGFTDVDGIIYPKCSESGVWVFNVDIHFAGVGYTFIVTINVGINGHTYVEMGDGLKWATMNVGATKPEEYGDYFAWGETASKTNYSWATYFDTSDGGSTFNKYTVFESVLDLTDDAARKIWKGTWRIPKDEEWTWLRKNCTWTWTDNYNGTGVAGRVVKSNVEGYKGNTIFIPAAGRIEGTTHYKPGVYANYWSSTCDTKGCAKYMDFGSTIVTEYYIDRCFGLTIRPVSD